MSILFHPVPLWALLVLTVLAAAGVALLHRRLQRRMDGIGTFIDNMDLWTDEIEERLDGQAHAVPQRLPGHHADGDSAGNRRSRL